jgi:hypothetical protein
MLGPWCPRPGRLCPQYTSINVISRNSLSYKKNVVRVSWLVASLGEKRNEIKTSQSSASKLGRTSPLFHIATFTSEPFPLPPHVQTLATLSPPGPLDLFSELIALSRTALLHLRAHSFSGQFLPRPHRLPHFRGDRRSTQHPQIDARVLFRVNST